MAEFKLGRIRFVWKDEWSSATTYYKDDVVRFGGKTYLCQIGHTSNVDFNADLDIVPSKWNLMSDGQRWRDEWSTGTVYQEGDLVKYGGSVYLCIDGHTSALTNALGLEDNSSDWQLFVEGFDWKDNWNVSFRYKVNDLVRYGGLIYICILHHTSASTTTLGLENDQSNWQVFSSGLDYKGSWNTLTRYKVNDLVKLGAGIWLCITHHTSGVTFSGDSAYWVIFNEGFEFENDWNISNNYQPGDVVRYGGNNYVSKTLNTSSNPLTNPADWDLFSENLRYLSDWSNTTSYKIGEVVKLNSYNYLAITDVPRYTLTVTAADSTSDNFTVSSTTGLQAGMTVRFTGSTFGGILAGARYFIKEISSLTEFKISISSSGPTFDLTTSTGSMLATISAEPPNTNFWSPISNGLFWRNEWTDDTEYNVGDLVKYGTNVYTCILAHRSEGDDGSTIGTEGGGQANSRPDQDITGTYWNVFNIGNELSVLTTIGDLVYQGGAGPVRLPIGGEGEVLRVGSTGVPEWTLWGAVDQVYYVSAATGEDRPYPGCGATLDKPWKTIRYACEQIDDGPRNPNAQTLLKLNRVFIQREVTAWIRAQILEYSITNPDPTSIWYNFVYDDYKCERDVGFIIDRLIWDLSHGGNLKIRAAAQSFVGAFGEDGELSSITENQPYLTLGNEYEQGIESYTYMLEVVEAVLSNAAPSVVYQNVVDDSSAVVSQYTNIDIVAETGANETIQELVGIVLQTLADQNSNNIPERIVPNTTIFVKTGQYRETLPIIVPAETAIVGDEKRSVNIKPATGLVSRDDVKYSIGALSRLETVLGEIVLGSDVSESPGNTAIQSIEFPYASSVEEAAIQKLIRVMQYQIDWRIGSMVLENSTDPVGYGSTFLSGFHHAKKLLKENKEFLKDEIIAYISVNYPNLTYSRTACRRDVGYIVDALSYDITYGGSWATLVAGSAYFDGNASNTLMIDSSEVTATVDAYARLKTAIQQIIQNISVTKSTGNNSIQWTDSVNLTGGSAASTTVGNLIDIIIDIIQGDSTRSLTPQINVTQIATNDTFTSNGHTLTAGDAVIPRITANGLVKNVKYWVSNVATNTFQLAASYGGSTLTSFTNGSGLDIDLETIDYPTATDAVTSTTALITAAQQVDAAQETIVEGVIDAINEDAWHTDFVVLASNLTNDDFEIYVGKGPLAHTYVSGGKVTKSNGTELVVTNFVYSHTTGYATVTTSTNHGLEAGDIVDIENITVSCLSTGGPINYVYPNSVSTDGSKTKIFYIQHKCIRDVRLITEAVMFDFMFDSNFQTMKAAFSYLRSSAVDVFVGGQKQVTRDSLTVAKDGVITAIISNPTAESRVNSLMEMVDDILYGATNEGSICQTNERNADWARLQLERNRSYVIAEIDAWVEDNYSTTVSQTSSATDILTCLDTSWMQRNAAVRFSGTVFGGILTGTTYYIQNVVSPTQFQVSTTRNSNTALNITISSSGTMSVKLYYNSDLCLRDIDRYIDAVQFDTQYPGNYKSRLAARYYANAVVGSLEEDMYYLRNGTGIRNQTLDGLTGDLTPENEFGTRRVTAGAYCSLDPGWGPDDFRTWIIKRSPYVQNVATFGYAAIGQKIDGDLHNGGNDSIVSNDFTQIISDGIGAWITNNGRAELVSVFTYYAHIGYLAENGGRIRGTNGNNSYGDFGSVAEGFDNRETPILCEVDNTNFVATVGEVTTDGVNKIWQFEYNNAGTDYTSATWTVSGGGAGAVTSQTEFRDDGVFQVRLLDNTDDSALAPEADGNFGGSGYISNSNTAQGGTTTSITIAAVDDEITGAYVGMKVIITAGTGAGQVGIVSSYVSGTKIANVIKESTGGAGWDHLVPGTAIVAPDASSTYTLEPRISFTSPSYSSAARTQSSGLTWTDIIYAPVYSVYNNIPSTTSGSGSGAAFTVARRNTKYFNVSLYAAGLSYARLDTVTISGTNLGGLSPTNDITVTITAVNSTTGEILDYEFSGHAAGGNFVAIGTAGNGYTYSSNGTTWTSSTMPSSSNWIALAHGELTQVETAGSFVVGRSYIITSLGNTVFTNIGAQANLVGLYFVASGVGAGTGTARPVVNHLVAISNSTTVNAYSTDGGLSWVAGNPMPAGISGTAVSVAYGIDYSSAGDPGTWLAIGSTGAVATSINGGESWAAGTNLGAGTWTSVTYGQGRWVAIVSGGTTTKYSTNGGATWTTGGTLPTSSTWISVAYGRNRFVAVSSNGTVSPAYSVDGGVTWSDTGVTGWLNQTFTDVKYGQGVFVATNSTSNNAVSSEDGIVWTTRALTKGSGTGFSALANGNPNQSSIWAGIPTSGSTAGTSAILGATAKGRAYVADNKIFAIRISEPGSAYASAPTITITDPNNLFEAPTQVRIGKGALGNPAFINRGAGFDSAIAEIDTGDGFADNFQSGQFLAVRRLTGAPQNGANVVLASKPNFVYKLVNVLSPSGNFDGARKAFFQVSPDLSVFDSPGNGTDITTRIRYSQVRLTGHDFLDIGTGNFEETNYPGLPTQPAIQANETADLNGGRVFYTSTDQDGNFRVGELFTIEQSTGIATLNADAFNIAGLSELSLGNITLGGNSATITEFSTDPFLTANSDSVVPTQRAIKAYIAAQIGGGGASLNVNSIVAGFIEVAGTQITTTTGGTIQMKANFNFQAGVRGYPIAWNYFLL